MKYKRCPVCLNENEEYMTLLNKVLDVPRIHCKMCNCAYWGSSPTSKPVYDLAYNLHFFRPSDIRQAERMARHVQAFIRKKMLVCRILEAGPGNGLTLLFFKLMGYDADGVEIEYDTSFMLNTEFHLNVFHCAFEDFSNPNTYDLIYSSHLIEHFVEPRLFMIAAKRNLMLPGFMFLYTPDLDCSGSCNPDWHHFKTRHPFEHCTILSKKSIYHLANATGFNVLSFERFEQYGSFVAILSNADAADNKHICFPDY